MIEKSLETSFMERQFRDLVEKAHGEDLRKVANLLLDALVVEKIRKDYLIKGPSRLFSEL